MLAHNKSGWTLLEYLKVNEDQIGDYDNGNKECGKGVKIINVLDK